MVFGDPIQWVVIAVVVIAVFLWGPSKIPALAKGLGQARRELSQAQKEAEDPSPEPSQPHPAAPQAPTTAAQASADEVLLQTARSLGIPTEGKTREQIAREIVARVSARS